MNGYLRRATETDIDLLFQWVNEQTVRRNAFSTAEITYEEHVKWYKKTLSRSDCRQYIYMSGNEAIGQIRLTINEDEAEIDYSICLEKRGMGYGKQMLSLLRMQVKQDFPNIRRLIGKVKPENLASQKAFVSMGYEEKYRVFEMEIE